MIPIIVCGCCWKYCAYWKYCAQDNGKWSFYWCNRHWREMVMLLGETLTVPRNILKSDVIKYKLCIWWTSNMMQGHTINFTMMTMRNGCCGISQPQWMIQQCRYVIFQGTIEWKSWWFIHTVKVFLLGAHANTMRSLDIHVICSSLCVMSWISGLRLFTTTIFIILITIGSMNLGKPLFLPRIHSSVEETWIPVTKSMVHDAMKCVNRNTVMDADMRPPMDELHRKLCSSVGFWS